MLTPYIKTAAATRASASSAPASPVRAETPANWSSSPPIRADRYAWPPLKGELERQQARRGQRRHQPPVQAAGLKPAERGDEDRERDRADAQPVQLGAPARCHLA